MAKASIEAMWRVAKRLQAARPAAKTRARRALPPLLYFTDPGRTPDPAATLAVLPRGAGVVYRAFGDAGALALGRRLARIARRRGLVLLVGADVALAVALRADGVHLPERGRPRAGAQTAIRRRFILTMAAHGLPGALRAQRAGVDALVISPVLASRSPSAGRPLGLLAFAGRVRRLRSPVYALGGVTAATARRFAGSGAAGLAAVDGLGASQVRT